MTTETIYLIEAEKPFAGHVISTLRVENGQEFLAYDERTVEQYERDNGIKLRKINNAELDKLMQKFEQDMRKPPVKISQEHFEDMLNCLPPVRWQKVNGYDFFMISEASYGNMHAHFARRGGQAWEIMASRFDKPSDIIARIPA